MVNISPEKTNSIFLHRKSQRQNEPYAFGSWHCNVIWKLFNTALRNHFIWIISGYITPIKLLWAAASLMRLIR